VAAVVDTPFTRGLTAGTKTLLENRAIRRSEGPARSRRRDEARLQSGSPGRDRWQPGRNRAWKRLNLGTGRQERRPLEHVRHTQRFSDSRHDSAIPSLRSRSSLLGSRMRNPFKPIQPPRLLLHPRSSQVPSCEGSNPPRNHLIPERLQYDSLRTNSGS
jgi:hypothetical protein